MLPWKTGRRFVKLKTLAKCNEWKQQHPSAKTTVSMEFTHTERSLHQLMFDDCNYEKLGETGGSPPPPLSDNGNAKPLVTVNVRRA